MIDVFSIFTPEFKSRTYVLTENQHSIIIDPTIYSISEICNHISSINASIDFVIPTHGHFDHIEGIGKLRDKYSFKVLTNTDCSKSFADPKRNYSFYFFNKNISLNPPEILIDEEVYEFKWHENEIKLIRTPGHSPCSICIAINNKLLFSGDTILMEFNPFSKFPDGNSEQLKISIQNLFHSMPHSTMVYPGHGASFLLGSIHGRFDFLNN
jgi:glyoxylase-like metal-dependent hydrolase (beta-lactamase superfamily II)